MIGTLSFRWWLVVACSALILGAFAISSVLGIPAKPDDIPQPPRIWKCETPIIVVKGKSLGKDIGALDCTSNGMRCIWFGRGLGCVPWKGGRLVNR